MNLFELEKKFILYEEWNTAPVEAQNIANEGVAEGVPTGIGKDQRIGWYVLQTAGQGPMLIWSEKKI